MRTHAKRIVLTLILIPAVVWAFGPSEKSTPDPAPKVLCITPDGLPPDPVCIGNPLAVTLETGDAR